VSALAETAKWMNHCARGDVCMCDRRERREREGDAYGESPVQIPNLK